MGVRTMSVFFALLTVVAQVGTVTVVASSRVRDMVRPSALPIAWLVAAVATGGSLYYSEVAGFTPCELCWFQRIAMYPLALILGIAALRKDAGVWRYAAPLALVGGSVSIYHYQLERFPQQASVVCSTEVPCTVVWVWEFGYISLPLMALSGFAAIIALLWIARQGGEGT